ncbi:MAG TPA: glycosyltransferase [Xanthobacteraceae bacterium]|nr:glycosyltransferase [Xanthobacteraceae bacterium]
MSPKVTVVIAAYNTGDFVGEAIESVLTQTLRDIELIVVDDGSTDHTQAVLRSFTDTRMTIIRQANAGVSAARNAGLAVARAPYIFFLDGDDVLRRDALAKMADTLDGAPHRVACFAHHVKIAEDGSPLSTYADLRWKYFPATDTLRHLIAKNFIACGAICIRTAIARRVGGFNPKLKLGEDWEFWCRLAALGDFAAMPGDVVLLYRQRFSGANHRQRHSVLRPNFLAIDAVYSNPAVRRWFSAKELKRRRRLAEIDAFWAGARNVYARGRATEFLSYLAVGAFRYPDSVFRWRLVYLFLTGLRRIKVRPSVRRSALRAPAG